MPFWLTGGHRGDKIGHLLREGRCTVGRSEAADLTLPSQTVSRNHAEIHVDETGARVTDLGSLNGTRINGQALSPDRPCALCAGDVVEFGSVSLRAAAQEGSSVPTWADEASISADIRITRGDTDSGLAAALAAKDSTFLGLLTEAGQLLVDPLDPQETFDRVVEMVDRSVSATRVLVLVIEEEGKHPVQRAARVRGAKESSPLMLSRTMLETVIREGTALLTRDAQADERFRNQQSVIAQELHSALAAPLVHDREIMGVLYLDTSDPRQTYTERDLQVLTLLGQMLGAKIANVRLVEIQRERDRLQRELETAAAIQRRLLPERLPEVDGYELRGMQETCEDVGGDLYDGGKTPGGAVQFLLGDVSGKGIGAALLMSDALGAIRVLREQGVGPDQIVERLNRHILKTTRPEHYLTLFLAELDPSSHVLQVVNAGHPPALLVRRDGSVEEIASTAFPVGLLAGDDTKFEKRSLEFPPGATLIIYSDGVSEAERGEEQFGDARLAEVAAACAGGTADETVERVLQEMASFSLEEEMADDLTLMVIRRLP